MECKESKQTNKTKSEWQIESKEGDKDQESIKLSTTPDLGYHMGK